MIQNIVKMLISKIFPYIDLLKSIKAIRYNRNKHFEDESWFILDLIVLQEIFIWDSQTSNSKICYFKDTEWKEEDPIYQSFKRVGMIQFSNNNDASKMLDMIRQANIIEVGKLNFDKINLNSFENLIDPMNFNYKIFSLQYVRAIRSPLSELTLENISKIKPQKLYQLFLKLLTN